MKLLFKQKIFSWFDSYDIYDEQQNPVYTVKGQLAWGHLLQIYDAHNNNVGTVKEKVLTWLPTFYLIQNGVQIGEIKKEFTFLKPKFAMNFKGWQVEGSFWEWDYSIKDSVGRTVATISKELFNWSDTYVLNIANPEDALYVLMLVLAIDAEKCSRDSGSNT